MTATPPSEPEAPPQRVLPEAVLVVGAGAVVKAWDPVLSALRNASPELKKWDDQKDRDPPERAEMANLWFSQMVGRLRWIQSLRQHPGDEIVYLHGSIQDSESIYLPAETANEIYRPTHPHIQEASVKFRVGLSNGRVVFYGLGLSMLDIELGAILWESPYGKDIVPARKST